MLESRKAGELFEEMGADEAIARGFWSRCKLNAHGVSVHLARLAPGVQNAHQHESLFELVMLVDGAVVAASWKDGGSIETFALKEQGDTVVFHPKQPHTLIVERDSQVVVVRFAEADVNPNERTALDLPPSLAAARDRFLETPRSVLEAVLRSDNEGGGEGRSQVWPGWRDTSTRQGANRR